MKEIYTLPCFNTFTGEYELVEFTDKTLYDECRRTLWNEEYHTKVFNENNIPFSSLKCGADKPVEEFHEFINNEVDPLEILLCAEKNKHLYLAIKKLTEREQKIVKMIYWEDKKTPEIAEFFQITRQGMNKLKQKIYIKLKNILENS